MVFSSFGLTALANYKKGDYTIHSKWKSSNGRKQDLPESSQYSDDFTGFRGVLSSSPWSTSSRVSGEVVLHWLSLLFSLTLPPQTVQEKPQLSPENT